MHTHVVFHHSHFRKGAHFQVTSTSVFGTLQSTKHVCRYLCLILPTFQVRGFSRHRNPERLNNLIKMTQLASGRAGIWTKVKIIIVTNCRCWIVSWAVLRCGCFFSPGHSWALSWYASLPLARHLLQNHYHPKYTGSSGDKISGCALCLVIVFEERLLIDWLSGLFFCQRICHISCHLVFKDICKRHKDLPMLI